MTLLTICKAVARESGFPAPGTIIGNTDKTAVRLLQMAQRTGKALARRHAWTGLIREHTFSTVASTDSYALPSDYLRHINDTVWNRTDLAEVGTATPQEWQNRVSSSLTQGLRDVFRLKQTSTGTRKFFIEPTPAAVETVAFEYISDAWVNPGATPLSAWAADADTTMFDEHLFELGVIWRMLKVVGEDFTVELNEFILERDRAISDDGGAPKVILHDSHVPRFPNIPDTGFGV